MNRSLIAVAVVSAVLCGITVVKALGLHRQLSDSRITTVVLQDATVTGYGLGGPSTSTNDLRIIPGSQSNTASPDGSITIQYISNATTTVRVTKAGENIATIEVSPGQNLILDRDGKPLATSR